MQQSQIDVSDGKSGGNVASRVDEILSNHSPLTHDDLKNNWHYIWTGNRKGDRTHVGGLEAFLIIITNPSYCGLILTCISFLAVLFVSILEFLYRAYGTLYKVNDNSLLPRLAFCISGNESDWTSWIGGFVFISVMLLLIGISYGSYYNSVYNRLRNLKTKQDLPGKSSTSSMSFIVLVTSFFLLGAWICQIIIAAQGLGTDSPKLPLKCYYCCLYFGTAFAHYWTFTPAVSIRDAHGCKEKLSHLKPWHPGILIISAMLGALFSCLYLYIRDQLLVKVLEATAPFLLFVFIFVLVFQLFWLLFNLPPIINYLNRMTSQCDIATEPEGVSNAEGTSRYVLRMEHFVRYFLSLSLKNNVVIVSAAVVTFGIFWFMILDCLNVPF